MAVVVRMLIETKSHSPLANTQLKPSCRPQALLRSQPRGLAIKGHRAKTNNALSRSHTRRFISVTAPLLSLRPHRNLLGRLAALQVLNPLDDALPANPINNLVLERSQSARSEVGLKRRDPACNVLGHLRPNRLVVAGEMTQLRPIFLDCGGGVERRPSRSQGSVVHTSSQGWNG
jgi:hypothetical protein